MLCTSIDATRVGAGRPPLVDEGCRAVGCHAVGQAIYKGVEGAEWERMYHQFVEMNRAVNVRPSGSSRAKTLRRQRGDEDYDQASQQKIVNWEAVRQDLWDNTCRIQQWLKRRGRVEVWDDANPLVGREQKLSGCFCCDFSERLFLLQRLR